MEYEVWHMESNELLGKIDVPRHVDHDPGAKVVIKVKGFIEHKTKGKFNAIEMRVCRMERKKGEVYFALETGLPAPLCKKLEGFTPKIVIPSLAEMFAFGGRKQ